MPFSGSHHLKVGAASDFSFKVVATYQSICIQYTANRTFLPGFPLFCQLSAISETLLYPKPQRNSWNLKDPQSS